MIDHPTLGQPVLVSAVLERQGEHIKCGERRAWVRVPLPKRIKACVMGLRNLQDGTTEWPMGDEGTTWHETGRKMALLLALDLRRKPIFALPRDCEDGP